MLLTWVKMYPEVLGRFNQTVSSTWVMRILFLQQAKLFICFEMCPHIWNDLHCFAFEGMMYETPFLFVECFGLYEFSCEFVDYWVNGLVAKC